MTQASLLSLPSGAQRLVFDGPLTIYDADTLKTRLQDGLEQTDAQGLELDLAQVDEIDLAGLQLLMLARRESQRLRRPLRIIAASEAVHEVIAFCRLAGFFAETLATPDQG